MNPFIRHGLILALAAGATALGSPGCADSESIIFIRQVQAPNDECQYDSSPSSLFFPNGILDVAFRLEYSAVILVGNQLVGRGNSSQLRTETARVQLEGTVIRVEDASGTVWGPVTVPVSGFVDPANGANATYGITETVFLGSEFGSRLRTELEANQALVRHFTSVVKVYGHTLGGMSVESGEWRYPLRICYGCLVGFPPGSVDTTKPTPNCEASADTGSSITPSCTLGQDQIVDCRTCKTVLRGSPVCDP